MLPCSHLIAVPGCPSVEPSSPHCGGSDAPHGWGHLPVWTLSTLLRLFFTIQLIFPLLSSNAPNGLPQCGGTFWLWSGSNNPSLGPGGCSCPDTGACLFCPKRKKYLLSAPCSMIMKKVNEVGLRMGRALNKGCLKNESWNIE